MYCWKKRSEGHLAVAPLVWQTCRLGNALASTVPGGAHLPAHRRAQMCRGSRGAKVSEGMEQAFSQCFCRASCGWHDCASLTELSGNMVRTTSASSVKRNLRTHDEVKQLRHAASALVMWLLWLLRIGEAGSPQVAAMPSRLPAEGDRPSKARSFDDGRNSTSLQTCASSDVAFRPMSPDNILSHAVQVATGIDNQR